MEGKLTGTVVKFSSRAGYGFIKLDSDNEKELFVHYTNILMDGYKFLRVGDHVEFSIGQNHKGDQAVDVRVLIPASYARKE